MTYDLVFAAIDDASDSFERQFGNLNRDSDFTLYGRYIEQAVVQFNSDNGAEYDVAETLQKWSDALDEAIRD